MKKEKKCKRANILLKGGKLRELKMEMDHDLLLYF
jgi:hypothetical protein